LAIIELDISDMAASLPFYRLLVLDIPLAADSQPHADAELGHGIRLRSDTEDTIRSFDPGWSAPGGTGHRVALGFACDSPADVDAAWAEITGAGYEGHLDPS